MEPADESLIRDPDLRERLEAARGGFAFDTVARVLVSEQQKRDAARAKEEAREARLAKMPPVRRRRAVVREVIENSPIIPDDLRHLHSIFAIVSLPRTRQPVDVREYERRSPTGYSLVVEAGKLMNPDGEWIAQPLPYGTRARLLLIHLCSEAIRQKSPTIEVADNLSGFLRDMGVKVTGGKNGTLHYFKQQINALAACHLRIGMWNGRQAATLDTKPFKKMNVWLPDNSSQLMLWNSTVTFSKEFYEGLEDHALPVNAHALKAFANSTLKLDLYSWVIYRINHIREPLTLTFANVHSQFGDGYKRERAFKAELTDALKDMREVLPHLPLSLSEHGLTLHPGDAGMVALPNRKAKKS